MAAAATEFSDHALIAGGWLNGSALREVSIQSMTELDWKEIAPMSIPRAEFGLAVLEKNLYAVGGCGDRNGRTATNTVEKLARLDGDWTPAPAMKTARFGHGVASFNGRIYACGGWTPDGPTAACEVLKPHAAEWAPAFNMPSKRWNFGFAAGGDNLYAVGGSTVSARYVPSADLFILDSHEVWTRGPELPVAMYQPSAIFLNEKLYVMGGLNARGRADGTIYEYDPRLKKWERLASFPNVAYMSALSWQGVLYVLGGSIDMKRAVSAVATKAPVGHGGGSSLVPMSEDEYIVRDGLVRSPGLDPAAIINKRTRQHDIALIIGVERYRRAQTVRYAESDAEGFSRVLLNLGVPRERTKTLIGTEATLPGLRKTIEEWIPRLAVEKSRVFVYFAGLGTLDVKTGARYLLPADGDPEFVDATAYPLEQLFDTLAKLPAKEIVVVLDAGFAGTGQRSIFPKGLRPLIKVRDISRDSRIHIVYGGGLTDPVNSSAKLKGGILTVNLIGTLTSASNKERDATLTLKDAFSDTRRKMAAMDATQTPVLVSNAPLRLF